MSSVTELESLASDLEAFIQSSIPKSSTVKKYGGTLFTVKPDVNESQFCGVFIQKKDVQLSFSNGAQLKDSNGVLQGSGKLRRHINYKCVDDIDYGYLAKLLKQSVKLSNSEA